MLALEYCQNNKLNTLLLEAYTLLPVFINRQHQSRQENGRYIGAMTTDLQCCLDKYTYTLRCLIQMRIAKTMNALKCRTLMATCIANDHIYNY